MGSPEKGGQEKRRSSPAPLRPRDVDIPTELQALQSPELGESTNRQVLIIGRTVSGFLLAKALHQVGHDPLVVPEPSIQHSSPVMYIDSWTRNRLSTVGLDEPVRALGTTVRNFEVAGSEEVVSLRPSTASRPPQLVPRERFRTAIIDELPEGVLRPIRSVKKVEQQENRIVVQFDGAVQESFDLVISTGDGNSITNAGSDPTVHVQEHVLEDHELPSIPSDQWTDRGMVQWLPLAGDRGLLRITTDSGHPNPAALVTSTFEINHLRSQPSCQKEVTVPAAVGPDDRWIADGIVFCGGSRLNLPASTLLDTPWTVDGVWMLLDELIGGPNRWLDGAGRYAQRRRQHAATLLRAGSQAPRNTRYSGGQSAGPLEQVYRFRQHWTQQFW